MEKLEIENKIDAGFIGRHLPFVLFLALLAIVHIANNHIAEGNVRSINKLEKEIKGFRWEYMTNKSELMFKSKPSEVAREVKKDSVFELRTPPI